MTCALNEIVGLPSDTPPTELACAADRYCEALFDKAACGDWLAHNDLLRVHAAYLVWAYGGGASSYAAASSAPGMQRH
jgi:hypothetical protein